LLNDKGLSHCEFIHYYPFGIGQEI
jgi:hypothetical protein